MNYFFWRIHADENLKNRLPKVMSGVREKLDWKRILWIFYGVAKSKKNCVQGAVQKERSSNLWKRMWISFLKIDTHQIIKPYEFKGFFRNFPKKTYFLRWNVLGSENLTNLGFSQNFQKFFCLHQWNSKKTDLKIFEKDPVSSLGYYLVSTVYINLKFVSFYRCRCWSLSF